MTLMCHHVEFDFPAADARRCVGFDWPLSTRGEFAKDGFQISVKHRVPRITSGFFFAEFSRQLTSRRTANMTRKAAPLLSVWMLGVMLSVVIKSAEGGNRCLLDHPAAALLFVDRQLKAGIYPQVIIACCAARTPGQVSPSLLPATHPSFNFTHPTST